MTTKSITKTQYAVLTLINKGLSINEISESRGVTSANTYQVVWRLARDGILKKKTRKESIYEITTKGLMVLGSLASHARRDTAGNEQPNHE